MGALSLGSASLDRASLHRLMAKEIEPLKQDFNLMKVKVFLPSGEIIYSTDPKDIGEVNTTPYFSEVVGKGLSHTQVVRRDRRSLEGEIMPIDVVETYVPIMRDGVFIGAFELYYDITNQRRASDRVILTSHAFSITVTLILLAVVLFTSRKAQRSIEERNEIERERERLIVELQDALANIKRMSGLLPICASCKKIRDDKGYWNQIESYIREHAEVDFSHGICPECARKLYPDYFKG
jgi:hypothetical protein